MKLELEADHRFGLSHRRSPLRVNGETDRLRRVLLCAPDHLEPVPCCSVTRESIRAGFVSDTAVALEGEVFEALRDVEIFKAFSIQGYTLARENGADFAPAFLKERLLQMTS